MGSSRDWCTMLHMNVTSSILFGDRREMTGYFLSWNDYFQCKGSLWRIVVFWFWNCDQLNAKIFASNSSSQPSFQLGFRNKLYDNVPSPFHDLTTRWWVPFWSSMVAGAVPSPHSRLMSANHVISPAGTCISPVTFLPIKRMLLESWLPRKSLWGNRDWKTSSRDLGQLGSM